MNALAPANAPALIRRMRPLLGTFVELAVQADADVAQAAIHQAFALIQRVHDALSFQSPDSELSRLNCAGGAVIKMSRLSRQVLRLAIAMARASDGMFNCTIAGRLQRSGTLPVHNVPAALACGDADDIVLLPDGGVFLRRPVALTLDGIAKGYAVDCAVRCLRRHGILTGWVNAGGDIRVFGEWVLPLQRRESDGTQTALAGLRNAAVASSRVDGERDPAWPAQLLPPPGHCLQANGIITVMAATAWRADALTKVAALTPPAQRQQRIRALAGEWLG
jgi:thiamine biosynthesis lipoprotein